MTDKGNDPNKWLGLLKWSLSYADGTRPTNPDDAPNPDDIAWLKSVFQEMAVNEADRMNEILAEVKNILDISADQNPSSKNDRLCVLLDGLKEIVEQIDMAQIFVKFGGLTYLFRIINGDINSNHNGDDVNKSIFSYQESSAVALSIIGTVAQNNITVQETMFQQKVVEKLSTLFLANACDNPTSSKVLYALSCAIRGHEALEELFSNDFAALVFQHALSSIYREEHRALHVGVDPDNTSSHCISLCRRVLFLANALLLSSFAFPQRQTCLIHCLVPAIFSLIVANDLDLRESTINLLSTIASIPRAKETFLLSNPSHKAMLDEVLSKRLTELDFTAFTSEEQESHEKEQVIRFRATLDEVVTLPPASDSNDLGTNNTNTSAANTNQPILLIESP